VAACAGSGASESALNTATTAHLLIKASATRLMDQPLQRVLLRHCLSGDLLLPPLMAIDVFTLAPAPGSL
jgi:hypothetical protein